MIAESFNKTSIDAAFQRLESQRGSHIPEWLRSTKRRALQQFMETGFPTSRDEEWRFTNIRPITSRQFDLSSPIDLQEIPTHVRSLGEHGEFHRLVFANGHFVSQLSVVHPLSEGVIIGSLGSHLRTGAVDELTELARHKSVDHSPFAALNTAFLEDGAFIHVPDGVVVERPIELVFISSCKGGETMAHPHNLFVLGSGGKATIIERYAGYDDSYFNNVVTEIILNEDADLDHYKLQEESRYGFHISSTNVYQRDRSQLSSHYVCRGASLARNEVNCQLDGEEIECTLNGVYLGDGEQHLDSRTRIDHLQPNCRSHELYKGILDDRAHGVFNGKIYVHQPAQKTDAKQSNQALLLSEDAVIDTKPQLEIYADDVKCTHGATVGELDEKAMHYLRSRGIPYDLARSMLIFAFANEVIQHVALPEIQDYVESLLLADQELNQC
jgi:Fe-S cluster assembly protein SufD